MPTISPLILTYQIVLSVDHPQLLAVDGAPPSPNSTPLCRSVALQIVLASHHHRPHHTDPPRDDGITPSFCTLPAASHHHHAEFMQQLHTALADFNIITLQPPPPRDGISLRRPSGIAPPAASGITPRLLAASHRARLLAASHRRQPSPRAVDLHIAWSLSPPPLSPSAASHRHRLVAAASHRCLLLTRMTPSRRRSPRHAHPAA